MTHAERLAAAISNLQVIVDLPENDRPLWVYEQAQFMLESATVFNQIEASRKQERENWKKEVRLLEEHIVKLEVELGQIRSILSQ